MDFRVLSENDFDSVHTAFLKAFSDYAIKIDMPREKLYEMLKRRGVVYSLSAGCFEGRELVGFILNGVDIINGEMTAYDTGTGVIPEFRGKKITGSIFDFLIPKMKKNGIKKYVLEVLKENEKAFNIYIQKGFQISRDFNCYRVAKEDYSSAKKLKDTDLRVEKLSYINWREFRSFWDVQPSWQNSESSVNRSEDKKAFLGVYKKQELMAYAVLYPSTGDLAQLAVKKNFRGNGAGTLLLKACLAVSDKPLSILNVEDSDKDINGFLNSFGCKLFTMQHELIKKI